MRPSKLSSLFESFSLMFVLCLLLSGVSGAAPCITLSKKSGPPTSKILVSGSGFEPNVGVDIYFDTKDEALVVTNGKGEFKDANAYAPRNAQPGQHWVTALERNNDKGAQQLFLVQTNWSQFRFSPEHDGLNPFENVLNPHTVDELGIKWTYNTDSVEAWGAPMVVDGLAYVATSPHLYALDASTGDFRWEATPHIYDLFSTNPAVANGIVYIGSAAGMHALDAKTGAELWIAPSSAKVFSSPAVANGVVYFDDGENAYSADGVYAIDAKTGKQLWFSTTFSSFCSPAVANGVVYVGADDYNLYALDAFTGAKLWTYRTGFVVRSAPAVANGVVYVGSYDKNVYALNASTGAELWSYATGGEVESSPAVADGVVYIGSDDGNFYALNADTGQLLWSYFPGALAVFDPTVANGVVYFGSWNPGAIYALNATTGVLVWSYALGGSAESDATIVNGRVYLSAGLVYAFARSNDADGDTEQKERASARPDLAMLHPDLTLKVSGQVGAVQFH